MKRSSSDTAETKLNMALFSYCITPQATRGLSPSEMLMGGKLRCRLDLRHPDLKKKVEAKQQVKKHFMTNMLENATSWQESPSTQRTMDMDQNGYQD